MRGRQLGTPGVFDFVPAHLSRFLGSPASYLVFTNDKDQTIRMPPSHQQCGLLHLPPINPPTPFMRRGSSPKLFKGYSSEKYFQKKRLTTSNDSLKNLLLTPLKTNPSPSPKRTYSPSLSPMMQLQKFRRVKRFNFSRQKEQEDTSRETESSFRVVGKMQQLVIKKQKERKELSPPQPYVIRSLTPNLRKPQVKLLKEEKRRVYKKKKEEGFLHKVYKEVLDLDTRYCREKWRIMKLKIKE